MCAKWLQREQELLARLRTANVRFSDAQTERIWAIVSAHQAGLSIRRIAGATGPSSSRIHQLNAPEAKEIPVWLSQLRQSSGGYAPNKEAERPKPETNIGPLARQRNHLPLFCRLCNLGYKQYASRNKPVQMPPWYRNNRALHARRFRAAAHARGWKPPAALVSSSSLP